MAASSSARPSLRRRLATAACLAATLAGAAATPAAAQRGAPQLIRDTEIEEILHQECDPIFAAAGLGKVDILIVQDNDINAGTINGQTMAINTGTILKADTPGEVQGVMAHESGHAARGDTLRAGGEMMRAGLAPMILTLALGVLAAAAGAPDAGLALAGSAPGFGQLGSLGYSREMESRADQAAVTYLEKAGYSAKGLVDFFDTMRYQEVFSEARRYKFFVDHPLSSDRIEALRRRAQEQPHYNTPENPALIERFEIMKAKLKAFTDYPQQTFITYSETDTSFPARYARAIAYYKELDTDRAVKLIDGLIKDYPTDPYLYELKGQVYFESGHPKEAEAAHAEAVKLKPGAPLLQVNLAQAILAQDDGKRADDAIPHLQKALAVE
ncbi:MAG: M48 family metalloprotease, partial [Caulobacteraceae bacterium]|nr:M48 family metalloprotease [Caulobacter sp.]